MPRLGPRHETRQTVSHPGALSKLTARAPGDPIRSGVVSARIRKRRLPPARRTIFRVSRPITASLPATKKRLSLSCGWFPQGSSHRDGDSRCDRINHLVASGHPRKKRRCCELHHIHRPKNFLSSHALPHGSISESPPRRREF